jgi:hypothetical protein
MAGNFTDGTSGLDVMGKQEGTTKKTDFARGRNNTRATIDSFMAALHCKLDQAVG